MCFYSQYFQQQLLIPLNSRFNNSHILIMLNIHHKSTYLRFTIIFSFILPARTVYVGCTTNVAIKLAYILLYNYTLQKNSKAKILGQK